MLLNSLETHYYYISSCGRARSIANNPNFINQQTETKHLNFTNMYNYVRFKVLRTVNMKITIFCHMTLCGLVDRYQQFVGTF
jgi:hypothetical protein